MRPPRTASHYLVLVASLAILLSAIPHGVGRWPMMREQLVTTGVPPVLETGLEVGWLFGSAAIRSSPCSSCPGARSPLARGWHAQGDVGLGLMAYRLVEDTR